MTKNPIINALGAFVYIALIAMFFYLANHFLSQTPDSILAPITVLSLFTFSSAVMGYIFLYQPLLLYFDGRKKEAVNLFLKTVATFGIITLFVLFLLFSRILG